MMEKRSGCCVFRISALNSEEKDNIYYGFNFGLGPNIITCPITKFSTVFFNSKILIYMLISKLIKF